MDLMFLNANELQKINTTAQQHVCVYCEQKLATPNTRARRAAAIKKEHN